MAHVNGLVDFTVEVFLVHEGKVLPRKHEKYNIWLGVGGHIEPHEDPNEAAVREVKEEVGMDIQLYDNSLAKDRFQMEGHELIPPLFLNRHRINDSHEHIALVYMAKAPTDEINQLMEEEKTTGIKWFTKEELIDTKDIPNKVRTYTLKALELIA